MAAVVSPLRRSQAERSAGTKQRLIDAAIECLVVEGYANTTAVGICERARLTRGALNHQFSSLAELFIGVLEQLYVRLRGPDPDTDEPSLEDVVRRGWARASHPDFKAVIEIWLAARNDRALGRQLHPAIAQLRLLFSPARDPKLAKRIGAHPEHAAFHRLAFETMIGLAVGRATSPAGAPVDHESDVIETLVAIARERDPNSSKQA